MTLTIKAKEDGEGDEDYKERLYKEFTEEFVKIFTTREHHIKNFPK